MNTSAQTLLEEQQAGEKETRRFDLMSKLPTILRTAGTAVLLIAMYSFLVKGWQNGNDLIRYLMMLGHTGALAAIGMASGHWLKDGKGARLLLTLALISIPFNFAILGAFILSQTGGIDIGHIPDYAAWSVDSLATSLLSSAGAMMVLLPVTLLGFTVLARSVSKKLSLLFLVSNMALLIPLRDPQLIAAVVIGLITFSIYFNNRTSREHVAVRTIEGITALGLQFLPLAVLMVRNLWLYSVDFTLLTVLSVAVFLMLRQASLYHDPSSRWLRSLNALSTVPAFAVMPFLGYALLSEIPVVVISLVIPLSTLASAAMIYDISRRSNSFAYGYRSIALGLVVISTIYNLFVFSSVASAMASVVTGFGLLILGYRMQYRNVFTGGVVLMLVGMIHQAIQLIHHFNIGNWIGMAIAGMVAIVLAAAIETRGGNIRTRIDHWSATIKSWEK
jgi:hypothetical protein